MSFSTMRRPRRQQGIKRCAAAVRRRIIQRDPCDELLEQLEHSPLPPRLLHLIIPADVIVKRAQTAAATLQLRQRGCEVILGHVGRDLQLFNLLTPRLSLIIYCWIATLSPTFARKFNG
ncbi:hypothetical protein KCP77_11020 [Salmonella enterica subsp. enterica]|nr:hypothetical protein KCP77_11020 [Salmonella enterica subsp. enterica]